MVKKDVSLEIISEVVSKGDKNVEKFVFKEFKNYILLGNKLKEGKL